MRMIDLRSDTVTLPSEEMRVAMSRAEVGDDVFGEDPTINRLQELAAALTGKEAALFVPSGTAGNQIAVLTHTQRGDEVILDDEAHIYYYEAGSPAMLSGVQLKPVKGLLSQQGPEVLLRAIRPPDIHFPRLRLVCLENTFNRGGGVIIPPSLMADIYGCAKRSGLAVHLDGARIFNAAVATGCDAREFTQYADSVMFCLSKGLGAPVGSLLTGSRDFIGQARRYRKALGGGMRQAGILAAAGLVALKNIPRLAQDHARARRLAEALAEFPSLEVNLDLVQTNMVMVKCKPGLTAADFVQRLAARGVKTVAMGPDIVRLVTHLDISSEDIAECIKVFNLTFAG
ncbi:MAG TPA: low-specificity L-threonine aldolase [Spirochaetia bacterium]|nr:low-specificity L-threonine aldolase [Spirochaetia bacterium]